MRISALAGRFPWKNAEVEMRHQQSVDIAQGVDAVGNKDCGDQGIMFRCVRWACSYASSHFYFRNSAIAPGAYIPVRIPASGWEKVTLQYEDGKR